MKREGFRRGWGRELGLILLMAGLAGCEWTTSTGPYHDEAADGATAPAGNPAPTDSGGGTMPAELSSVQWLHTDVSGWAETATLSASVGGGTINLNYDKARVWPAVDGVNANPWVFVNLNGQWYAATFEYLRHGQTAKPMGVLDGRLGDHIKVSPLNQWRPRSGERIGLMVSGLARSQLRNVRERSNVVMVTWP